MLIKIINFGQFLGVTFYVSFSFSIQTLPISSKRDICYFYVFYPLQWLFSYERFYRMLKKVVQEFLVKVLPTQILFAFYIVYKFSKLFSVWSFSEYFHTWHWWSIFSASQIQRKRSKLYVHFLKFLKTVFIFIYLSIKWPTTSRVLF